MKVTIDNGDPLSRTLAVLSAMYGATIVPVPGAEPPSPAGRDEAVATTKAPAPGRRPARRAAPADMVIADAKAVREWAVAAGHQISPRGAISTLVRAAYHAAHLD